MGVNDAGEMLVVAKAECVRLEAENARLHAEALSAFDDRDAALERLGLEVAGRVAAEAERDALKVENAALNAAYSEMTDASIRGAVARGEQS